MSVRAMSVDELAGMVGVSASSVYQQLHETGEVFGVHAYRVRRRWLIPREPIEKLFPPTAEGES